MRNEWESLGFYGVLCKVDSVGMSGACRELKEKKHHAKPQGRKEVKERRWGAGEISM